VLPPKYGGADIAAFRYAEYLDKLYPNQILLLGGWNKDIENVTSKFPFIKSIKFLQLKSRHWRTKRIVEIINWHLVKFALNSFFKREAHKFDIVHSFNSWSNLNLLSLQLGRKYGKKVIAETCLIGADDPITILKTRENEKLSINPSRRAAYLSANFFISKSSYMTTQFKGFEIIKKTKEAPYFVNLERFYPVSEGISVQIKNKLNIPIDRKIILFAGELNERKGIQYLLKGLSNPIFNDLKPLLILAGPFSPNKEFNQIVKREIDAISSRVFHFEGKVDFVNELMQVADFYCLPSFKEGFPISIIEALCTGLPVIGSDIPEINGPQIIDGENGFILQPGDIESIEKTIFQALSITNEEMKLMKENALLARKKFGIESIVNQYLDIYSS